MISGYLLRQLDERRFEYGQWIRDSAPFGPPFNRLVSPEPMAATWAPLEDLHWSASAEAERPDVTWFSGWIVLKQAAEVSRIWDLLGEVGEWLPLGGHAAGYSLFHCLEHIGTAHNEPLRNTAPRTDFRLEPTDVWESRIGQIPAFGVVTFESSDGAADGLRQQILQGDVSGVEFVKFWDEAGPQVFDRFAARRQPANTDG